MGEAVAAVAAPTEALAERALRAIKVDYEVLSAMLCADDALKDGAEETLTCRMFDPEAAEAAARIAEEEISPITDARATETYRRRVSRVIVRAALKTAWQRAGEGSDT